MDRTHNVDRHYNEIVSLPLKYLEAPNCSSSDRRPFCSNPRFLLVDVFEERLVGPTSALASTFCTDPIGKRQTPPRSTVHNANTEPNTQKYLKGPRRKFRLKKHKAKKYRLAGPSCPGEEIEHKLTIENGPAHQGQSHGFTTHVVAVARQSDSEIDPRRPPSAALAIIPSGLIIPPRIPRSSLLLAPRGMELACFR